MEKSFLNINNISFSYGNIQILRNITISVKPGEILGIIGANGSGKSTLINVISGVLKPTAGTIEYLDDNILSWPPQYRARLMSVVPQSRHIPSYLTVYEAVSMGRTPYMGFFKNNDNDFSEMVEMAMEYTRTSDISQKRLSQLSEGQIQKVLIARSLAQNCPITLLDEPTSSLDVSHQIDILDTIKRIQEKNKGITLLSIHDLTLAAQYCDRIGLLQDGSMKPPGGPREILTNENILSGYGANVHIIEHPSSGLPVVIPISGK
ncbi:MAG: hypothetical protein CL787_05550 [Chloroflexi bacterium]|nr:hypothetical protein [Chloroflexota bacterium]MQF99389.1 ABC transporter ATP-binding protein [SAR202 cluster bacterium]|tara:strand:- start:3981 stop:4769 length:789 start_codon:yes stop_codon:yes gene_type:complete